MQQEGTFELARQGDADIVVSGVVQSIDRHEQSFHRPHPIDPRLPPRNPRPRHHPTRHRPKLVDQDVMGHTMLRVLQDLPSAERQAMPLLAANLARNIVSSPVDGSW